MANSILKLEASAGSGKTYRLALEYLGRLLLAFSGPGQMAKSHRQQREALASILAITFTVKAAQEMKRRIVEKLKVFALSEKDPLAAADRDFLSQLAAGTGLAPEKIIALSGALIELVLASYDDFNVTTIDSLMSAMVKAVSPDLDLPADYEIAVDAGDEMESRGRAMLSALADGDWPRLERFLEDFRSMNAGVVWKTDEAIVAKVAALFRISLRQGHPGAETEPGELRRRLATSRRNFQDALRPLAGIMAEEPLKNGKCLHLSGTYATAKLLNGIGEALDESGSLRGLEQLITSSFFRKPAPDVLLVKKAPADYLHRFSAAYRPAQSALKNAALDFCAFKTLPYREFLDNFAAEWQRRKKTLFVEEFSHTLAGLFERWREEAFPYLYLKLSDRFNSFLFDEFQDTSTLQFRALAPLIDEVLSRRESGSLFIVGDRKQAIYRWRGGNTELMEEPRLEQEVPAIRNLGHGGFSRTLDQNWRSKKEIVAFNNDFWEPGTISRIAPEADLQQAIAVNFKASQQKFLSGKPGEGGYVEVSLQVEAAANSGEEAAESGSPEADDNALSALHLDEIERTIRRLHDEHGYDYAEIAVLVRKNDQVRAVIRRLGSRSISSISDQSLLLGANARVAEIIAFLRFLDYPPDNLHFFAFISGAIFFQAAQTRFPGEMKAFGEDMFIGCRGPFYKLFQEKFPGCWKGLIEPFFQSVGFLPPYDLFSDITQAFSLYENFSDDTPFFMALGDALHRAERDNGSSIAAFLRRWQKMVEDGETPAVTIPENTRGVRVLTMHQSKGLEFPAVIVPLNDRGGRSDDNLYWDREGLFYINKEMAPAHPDLKAMVQRENIRSSLDLLNLLYVAFTRAREALFIPVAVRDGIRAPEPSADGLVKKISRASDAIGRHPLLAWSRGAAGPPFCRGNLERKESRPQAGERPPPIPSKKMPSRSWQSDYLVFRKADVRQRRDRPETERGNRIHDLLSRLAAFSTPFELEARVRELAAQAGWPGNDTETVVRFLCRDDVFLLLGQGHETHPEKEVVVNTGDTPKWRRFDRLQAGPKEVVVIDFKTGKEKSDEHRTQLRDYLAAASSLYPGRTCRGYLLYIDRDQIEEVPCSS